MLLYLIFWKWKGVTEAFWEFAFELDIGIWSFCL